MKRNLIRILGAIAGVLLLSVTILWVIGGFTTTAQTSITISAPPDKVFRFLTEPDKMKQWLDGVTNITPLNGGECRVGAKARVVVEKDGNRLELEDEVVRLEKNQLLELKMTCSMFDMINRYEITADGDKSQLRQTLTTNYKGLVRVFVPLMGKAVDRKLVEGLERLRKFVEAE
jgi:uncharacterized protein YndB with AHSA1/START domain